MKGAKPILNLSDRACPVPTGIWHENSSFIRKMFIKMNFWKGSNWSFKSEIYIPLILILPGWFKIVCVSSLRPKQTWIFFENFHNAPQQLSEFMYWKWNISKYILKSEPRKHSWQKNHTQNLNKISANLWKNNTHHPDLHRCRRHGTCLWRIFQPLWHLKCTLFWRASWRNPFVDRFSSSNNTHAQCCPPTCRWSSRRLKPGPTCTS